MQKLQCSITTKKKGAIMSNQVSRDETIARRQIRELKRGFEDAGAAQPEPHFASETVKWLQERFSPSEPAPQYGLSNG